MNFVNSQYVNWNKSRAEFEIDEDLITAIKGLCVRGILSSCSCVIS